ncbi:MAG: hypothetical protein IGS48_07950 [Oscillatoriales cyanobacterium C42_A2020_001]|nr:hypothetical protein [Leptolyngbyaceae cyanobacterium C42_A2020_001]
MNCDRPSIADEAIRVDVACSDRSTRCKGYVAAAAIQGPGFDLSQVGCSPGYDCDRAPISKKVITKGK